jgi:hypothetical protein
MNLRTLSLACTLAVLLPAQNAMPRGRMDPEGGSAPPPASLLLFESKGSRALSDGFAALLRSEALQAFEVPRRHLALGAGPDRALLARHHLAAKPQWVLVDRRRDAVIAGGEGVPDPDGFARSLLQAGFKDRVRELRAYLKVHPQSIEARELLLRLLRPRAERAAQRLMGVSIPSARERLRQADLARALPDASAPDADLAGAKPLDPAEDLEAWGAFAQELDTVFKNGQWRELNGDWVREARPLDAASPTLRLVYQRWQPAVEAALRAAPGSEPFWELWLWMSRARGGAPLRPLLASLQPSPLTPPGEWPPPRAVRALFASARSPEDWRALKEHYLGRWEREPHLLRDAAAGDAPLRNATRDIHNALLDGDWTSTLAPLLECCLRGGEAFHADALFMEALTASRWGELPSKAAALARRCGQPALAARWSALRPPPSSR